MKKRTAKKNREVKLLQGNLRADRECTMYVYVTVDLFFGERKRKCEIMVGALGAMRWLDCCLCPCCRSTLRHGL
jgi:hypothetical protein